MKGIGSVVTEGRLSLSSDASNSAFVMRRRGSRKWRFFNRNMILIVVAIMMTWGIFLVLRLNREVSTDYDRAMARCITDRNQAATPPIASNAASIAVDCAHNTLEAR